MGITIIALHIGRFFIDLQRRLARSSKCTRRNTISAKIHGQDILVSFTEATLIMVNSLLADELTLFILHARLYYIGRGKVWLPNVTGFFRDH